MVVFEPVNQIARARNKGAEAATGGLADFCGCGFTSGVELFADAAEAMESGKYVFGGCTMKLDENYLLAGLTARLWNGISRMWKWAAGAFIFCETASFREVGGFDNQLFASEEIDLSKRLAALARKKDKRGIILSKHPMVTSGRKMHFIRRDSICGF